MARRPPEPEANLVLERLQSYRDAITPTGATAPVTTRARLLAPARVVTTPAPTTSASTTSASMTRAGRAQHTRRQRRVQLSLLGIIGVALAVLMGGGALLSGASGSPAATDDALANSVVPVAGAPTVGSTTGMRLNSAVIDIAATPTGRGYWIAAADGGVFAYGDARYDGSRAGHPMSAPVVGIAATASGRGYWLAAADGGVFSYGDARFLGSGARNRFNVPVAGIAATTSGSGYWLVGADGGVFAYGDAPFVGWVGALTLRRTIRGASR